MPLASRKDRPDLLAEGAEAARASGEGRRSIARRRTAAGPAAARIALLAIAAVTALGGLLPGAARAEGLISSFQAGVLTDENVTSPEEKDYATQAAGHPDVAFTNFSINTLLEALEYVRVDLPPGLSVDAQAIPRCSHAGTGLEASCAKDTQVGVSHLKVNAGILGIQLGSGKVYNMVPPAGSPADFAFEVTIAGLITSRTDLVAGLRYYPQNGRPGDYGEYFTISGIPNTLGSKLVSSELDFWGAPEEHNGGGATNNAFLSNPTVCAGPQTTYMFAHTYKPAFGEIVAESTSFTTPVGASGCSSIPFSPTVALTPSTTQRDQPDGVAVDVHVPQDQKPADLATSQLREARVVLPEGMSLNPSGARGLEACTDAQFGEGTNSAVACPAGSEVGTAEIVTPVLGEALKGKLYVGEPKAGAGPESGEEYRLFVDAENESEGIKVRLTGNVSANASTGRLTATFANDPQLPFSDLFLNFKQGPRALFANALTCGTATLSSTLVPYSGNAAATPSSSFAVDNNGSGGACPGTLPFAPAAGASLSSKAAGATTNLTLNLTRADGEGTLSGLTVKLPEGLLANLNGIALCGEPQAAAGSCSEESKVGSATIAAGAGSEPLSLTGKVFLTGPYNGAPLGLSIAVPAVAGPYNLGTVVVRAAVNVDTVNGQITIASDPLPTIVGGVPLRLKGVKLEINRSGFLVNPTTCGTATIAGTITSTSGQSEPFSSPAQIEGCSSLSFAPTLKVTPATTRADNPLGLTVELGLPSGSAELHSATLTLPAGVAINPSAAEGLEACTDEELGAGTNRPVSCPAGSVVGSVEIATPLMPTPLTGSIYIGKPLSSEPESGQEFRIFVAAENPTYGISVRLVGALSANRETGRLTATFANTPPMPFTAMKLTFRSGTRAPLASPPGCGPAATSSALTATTGASATPSSSYSVAEGAGGGACPASAPFAPTAGATLGSTAAGAQTTLTLQIARNAGEEALGAVSATLPPGLLGRLSAVALCGEPQAAQGACEAASRIGSALVTAGVGSEPLALPGTVYLSGPYGGDPFGLSIVVPALAGPYDLGTVVVRAGIAVDPANAHLTITGSSLPTILGGVPLRLDSVKLAIDRAGFMLNPTSCGALSIATTVFSSLGSSALASSPFTLTGCESLPFEPGVSASTQAPSSREEGAGLNVALTYPAEGEANLAAVSVTMPVQLPARTSTLRLACLEAVFIANPAGCPAGSRVGEASVSTPVLPDPLSGPAYLVASGSAAFPALDLVLSGDGVQITLHGQTDISSGITSATFSGLPDVPVRSIDLSLPAGPESLLGANGTLCEAPLELPATLTAQSGRQLAERATISVSGCAGGGSGTGSAGATSASLSGLTITPARFRAAARGGSAAALAASLEASASRAGHRARRGAPVGATVTYRASRAGAVVFTIERLARGAKCSGRGRAAARRRARACTRWAAVSVRERLRGVRRGARCVAPGARHGHARACTLVVSVSSFRSRARAGRNRLRFTGRLGGRPLSPGAYRLVAHAAGSRASVSVRFWVVRR
jgi:hypothetical protein